MSNAVAWVFWFGLLPALLLRVLVEQVRANAREREQWSGLRERQAVKEAMK